MSASTKYYTGTFSDSTGFTVSEDDNAIQVSLTVLSGTCTVVGNFPFKGNLPTPFTLSAGMSVTISGYGLNPIAGITVTPSSPGSVAAIIMF